MLKLRFFLPPLPGNIDVKQASVGKTLNVNVWGERDGVRGRGKRNFNKLVSEGLTKQFQRHPSLTHFEVALFH